MTDSSCIHRVPLEMLLIVAGHCEVNFTCFQVNELNDDGGNCTYSVWLIFKKLKIKDKNAVILMTLSFHSCSQQYAY